MKIEVFIALVVRLSLVHAEIYTLNITCICEKGEDYTELYVEYEFGFHDKSVNNGKFTRIGKAQRTDNVLGGGQQNGMFTMQLPKLNEEQTKIYKKYSKSLELYIEVWDSDDFASGNDFLGRVLFKNFKPECAVESASKYPAQCSRKNFDICSDGKLCGSRTAHDYNEKLKGYPPGYKPGTPIDETAYAVQCPNGTPCGDKKLEIKFSYHD